MKLIGIAAALCALALSAQFASAQGYRIEGGVGGTFGQNDAKAGIASGGSLVTIEDNDIGGSGLAAGGAIWADGPLAALSPALRNISLGLEYRHFENSTTTTVSVVTPSGSGSGAISGDFTSDNLLFDVAWRLNDGVVHPFVGAGGGVAFVDLNGTVSASSGAISVGTPTSFSAGASSTVAAGHAFIGLDYDITPQVYVGAVGDFYFTDTVSKQFSHTNFQLSSQQISLLGHLGWKF